MAWWLCRQCGKHFAKPPSLASPTCSPKCRGLYFRKPRPKCKMCENECNKWDATYCSKQCMGKDLGLKKGSKLHRKRKHWPKHINHLGNAPKIVEGL